MCSLRYSGSSTSPTKWVECKEKHFWLYDLFGPPFELDQYLGFGWWRFTSPQVAFVSSSLTRSRGRRTNRETWAEEAFT